MITFQDAANFLRPQLTWVAWVILMTGLCLITKWSTNARWKKNIKLYLDDISKEIITAKEKQIMDLTREVKELRMIRVDMSTTIRAARVMIKKSDEILGSPDINALLKRRSA